MLTILLFIIVFFQTIKFIDVENKLTSFQKQIDDIQSTQFIFEKGTLNFTAELFRYNPNQWLFKWPNDECVCPGGIVINGSLWHDLNTPNCTCIIYFNFTFLEKPKLLFNTYYTQRIDGVGNPSVVDDYMVYYPRNGDTSMARSYHKNMTIYNDKFVISLGNNPNIWTVVNWYAFGYVK